MKRILLILSLILTVGVSSSFARDEVNERVLEAFRKTFVSAQSVNWTESGDYFKASFVLGSHRAVAYFSEDGNFEGCIRDLFYDQLPMIVMTSIDKRFPDAVIIDVREITNDEGTHYRLTLEAANKKYRVKIDASGNLLETEKQKK